VWGLLFLPAIQLGLTAFVELCHPELSDPEYSKRLTLLRTELIRDPTRPLLLLVGSSRTVTSFCPEMLPPLPAASSGKQPVVFNFSHVGAGPLMTQILVERLLREGIRPRWLLVEVLPPKLFREGPQFLVDSSAGLRDLPLLQRYVPPGKLYRVYLTQRLLRNHGRYATEMVRLWLPGLITTAPALKVPLPAMHALGGYAHLRGSLATAERQSQMEVCERQWSWVPGESQVTAAAGRATRDLLDLCRREGIGVALFLSPEGSSFRQLYSAEARAAVERFCAGLSRDFKVPVVDARNWLPDSAFSDSHHTLLAGARTFTQRLGREVIQPLLASRLSEKCP
jgi:hypothetical protein